MLGVGTLLTASPLLLSWHDQGELSRVDIGHLSPGGPLAWSASAVLAGLGASWVLSFLRRSGRARRRAALPRWAATEVLHEALAGAEVRVAPTLEPVAFAVPGRDRHVVVSESVTRLAAPERRAVLAHEGAGLGLGARSPVSCGRSSAVYRAVGRSGGRSPRSSGSASGGAGACPAERPSRCQWKRS